MTILDWEKNVNELKERVNSELESIRPYGRVYSYLRRYGMRLETVEDNIALWSVGYTRTDNIEERFYFYSNLEGKLLFNGESFIFATPFSNGLAVVLSGGRKYYLIDRENKEVLLMPEEAKVYEVSNIRNDMMSAKHSGFHYPLWGSYKIDRKEKTLECVIPFIWNYLNMSRTQNQVYAGISDGYYVTSSGSHERSYIAKAYSDYSLYDWSRDLNDPPKFKEYVRNFVSRMDIETAQNKDYIKYFLGILLGNKYDGYQVWLYFQDNDIGAYFGEKNEEKLCTNDGTIVENESLEGYQKVLCQLKSTNNS